MSIRRWSYGGMVITGVAERMPERIAHLVFLDASVPRDGESSSSMTGPDWTEFVLEQGRTAGDGWRFGKLGDPAAPQPGDNTGGRSTPQPLQTFLQPLAVRNPGAAAMPRTYIRCTDRQWPSDAFCDGAAAMLERCAAAARDAGWGYHNLPTTHDGAMVSTGGRKGAGTHLGAGKMRHLDLTGMNDGHTGTFESDAE